MLALDSGPEFQSLTVFQGLKKHTPFSWSRDHISQYNFPSAVIFSILEEKYMSYSVRITKTSSFGPCFWPNGPPLSTSDCVLVECDSDDY